MEPVPEPGPEPVPVPPRGKQLPPCEEVIREHYSFLVENLRVNMSALVDAAVFTADEAELVSSEQSMYAQNVLLLRLLISKSQRQFNTFLQTLDQQYINDYLTFSQGQPASRRLSTLYFMTDLELLSLTSVWSVLYLPIISLC